VSYVFAFLGFAALIVLHEAGHFVAAKAVGMRVERFSLFFGPMLVKFRRGETEYGIGPIPLGGYVKITGMSPLEEIPEEQLPRAYFNQPVWKRVVVILAGPLVNIVIAFVLLVSIALSQGQIVPTRQVEDPVAPALGLLRSGDTIVEVDGRKGLSVAQITAEIASHHCAGRQTEGCVASTPVRLVVRRDGRLLSYSIFPRYSTLVKRVRVGFTFGITSAPISPGRAATASLSFMWLVTHSTVTTVARIFQPKQRAQLSGVVGVYHATQQNINRSASRGLEVLALISLSLGVINLFPFLPLDGGHIFWAVAEKIRGRRIPYVVLERAGMVGFALIIMLFVIGLHNDLSTLTGHGFP
jgi:regulator of sigma E protease